MNTLTASSILERWPDLNIQLDGPDKVIISHEDGEIRCASSALAIINACYMPRSFGGLLGDLSARFAHAPAGQRAEDLVFQLYRAGMLRDVTTIEPRLRADTSGYDSAPIHVAMLNDRTRVSHFLAGIREVVRPGDVVLDLGTGVGIFAIAAAQAGARHVYAVEANGIAHVAQAAFAANGLADRITLIRGWSSQITLPERADVLISEMVGNEPTADYMLEVMRDACKRLLKPDARMVPGRVRIYGIPLTVPNDELANHMVMPDHVRAWQARYGINFGPMAQATQAHTDEFCISVRPYAARSWPVLSEPVLLADIDMLDVNQLQIDTAVSIIATANGILNGLLVYFEVQLGPGTCLSLNPAQSTPDTFRFTPVWVLQQPIAVQAGQTIGLTYRYRVPGIRSGVSVIRDLAKTQ